MAVPADFPENSQSPAVTLRTISSETGFANRHEASGNAAKDKRSLSGADSERFQIARPGFEPGLSDSESLDTSSDSVTDQEVALSANSGCTTGCTNLPENEHGEVSGGLVAITAESLPIKADSFSAALAMIASLPLSDAEKVDAVRRLMAEQTGRQAGERLKSGSNGSGLG